MWLCDDKLKEKTGHFRLPSAAQKRCMLKLPIIKAYTDNYAQTNKKTARLSLCILDMYGDRRSKGEHRNFFKGKLKGRKLMTIIEQFKLTGA